MALIDMVLTVQPYIEGIPRGGKKSAWAAATANDGVTVKSWDKIWIDQTERNLRHHNIIGKSVIALSGNNLGKPVILMGSGPSIEKNWKELICDGGASIGRCAIPIVTSVHNFSFCEDRNIMRESDYYVVLDAGDICIKELSEGGKEKEQFYWERTEKRTLIAYHGTHPEFLRKWKGPIYFFTTPCASRELSEKMKTLIDYTKVPAFNVGGNVMGASLYFSRAILGSSVPIFMGMDLCFSYNRKFHPWECDYNNQFAGVVPWTDIYGNRVYTWPSYFGFKSWFDYMACGGTGNNPQLWINATEGGIMGAYQEGNIKQIIQLDLKTTLQMFNMSYRMPEIMEKSKEMINLLF